MKAVILAAGIASRLRPLTDNTPKCLLKVGAKNILALTLDNIVANKISEVIIVTGYLEHRIKDFVSSQYPTLNPKYVYNELYASTNNIYSLWLAKEIVAGDEMMLLDSDIIFDRNIIAKLLASTHANCLALKRHDVSDEEMKVKVEGSGRVSEISKEVKREEAMGESIGIEKFSAPFVEKLFEIIEKKFVEEKKVNVFYEAAFQELIGRGENIFVVDVTDNMCMEIDTAGDLEAAAKMISGYPIEN